MSLIRRGVFVALLVGTMALAAQQTASAYVGQYAWDGVDPAAPGAGSCGYGWTVYTRQLTYGYLSTPAYVDLRYNSGCRVVWSRTRSYLPGCQPGQDYCGRSRILRLNDWAQLWDMQGHESGRRVWWTPMLNDKNMSSFAYGSIDNGPYTFSGSTPSW